MGSRLQVLWTQRRKTQLERGQDRDVTGVWLPEALGSTRVRQQGTSRGQESRHLWAPLQLWELSRCDSGPGFLVCIMRIITFPSLQSHKD